MITANLHFGHPWGVHELTKVIPMLAKHGVTPASIAGGALLKARVNHGRWIVDCECKGAELAWEEGLFMCLSCYNAGHKHQYRKTVFPKSRHAIELLLLQRPISNRNWYVGETLASLQAENVLHTAELLEVK